MKKKYLILIFITLYSVKNSFSQNLTLKLSSKDSTENITLNKIDTLKSFKSKKKISSRVKSIRDSLQRIGFFHNFIDSSYTVENKNFYILNLGKKTDSIYIKPSKSFSKKTKKLSIKDIDTYLMQLKDKFQKEGKPFTKIQLTNLSYKKNKLFSSLLITESKKRTIDSIVIKGYTNFPEAYLKYYFKTGKSSIFNKKTTSILTQKIKTLDFIEQTKEPEVLFNENSTKLFLYLKKKKRSSFQGLLNFNSTQSDGIIFSGNINLFLKNIFDTGEELAVNWNSNGRERQNFDLKISTPFIFNSPVSAGINFEIHKQDSSFLSSKFIPELNYRLNNKSTIGLLYESETSTNTLKKKNTINIQNFNTNYFGLSFSYENIDYAFFPENSFSFNVNTLAGNKTTSTYTDQQLKINLISSMTYRINSRNAFYVKSNTGAIFTDRYLPNELYRIGGPKSIRGFEQQSIFASKFSCLNLEYRFLTSKKSFVYSITDLTVYENINTEITRTLGYGLGFTFRTKNLEININATKNTSNKSNINFLTTFKSFF